jgi:hypothetical protein
MKVTTLACDCCTAVVPAVTSRSLVNGKPRPRDPSLDLCRRHLKALLRAFRPRKHRMTGRPRSGVLAALGRVEQDRAGARERWRRHAPKRTGRKVRIDKGTAKGPWEARMTTLLALMPAVGTIDTKELLGRLRGTQGGTQWTESVYRATLTRLKAKGLLFQKSGRRNAKYGRMGTGTQQRETAA